MNLFFAIAFALLGIYCLAILYFRVGWLRANQLAQTTDNLPKTFITIVVPARNEEKNIGSLLKTIAAQNYPPHLFETIVINDFSDDATEIEVAKFPGARLINLSDYVGNKINSYKKKAIEIAIAQAKGDLIVTTDADCLVLPNWLGHIAAYYESTGRQFFTMPVLFTNSGSFLDVFQSLDFMSLQGITAASAHNGSLSMANGANLAYTKSAFKAVNGFENIDAVASGDDMLLMHKIARAFPGKTGFLKSKEVIVATAPMPDLRSFFNQRIRWASKADKYDDKRVFWVLLLVWLLNFSIILFTILSFVFAATYWSVWLLLLVKTICELIFLVPVAKFFGRQALLWWFPFMQPFHIVYMVVAGLLGKFGKYEWKGRVVK